MQLRHCAPARRDAQLHIAAVHATALIRHKPLLAALRQPATASVVQQRTCASLTWYLLPAPQRVTLYTNRIVSRSTTSYKAQR